MDGLLVSSDMKINYNLTDFFNTYEIHNCQIRKEEGLKLWQESFCGNITAEMKACVPNYNDGFLWHIFSFGLVQAMEGESAERIFDEQNKDRLILFFERSNDAYYLENAEKLTSDALNSLEWYGGFSYADVYVIHPADRWAYVRTHEKTLGPYYLDQRKK